MPGDYATIEDVTAYAYQVQDEDAPILTMILGRASRLFDLAAGVTPGYFDPYVTGDASARKFWGDGTNFLKVDPYDTGTTPTVAMAADLDTPTFVQANPNANAGLATNNGEFFLVRTYGDDESRFEGLRTLGSDIGPWFALDFFNASELGIGWPDGIKVTVTAKWGFAAIPEDVKEAVLETAIAIWRGKDAAFARVVNLGDNQQIFSALPDRAKLIADKYRARRMVMA